MIGSCALKARVEEHLGVALAPSFFDKAEQYARRKLDLCNERAGGDPAKTATATNTWSF